VLELGVKQQCIELSNKLLTGRFQTAVSQTCR